MAPRIPWIPQVEENYLQRAHGKTGFPENGSQAERGVEDLMRLLARFVEDVR